MRGRATRLSFPVHSLALGFAMGRIRSFIRRAARPASMVAVAGLLAVSLTVTTTQRAEANPIAVAPVILAAEGIVGGASLPLVLPSVLATSLALHPVGWAIGAGVVVVGLAVGAYYTKDYWLPYVTGFFGTPRAELEADPAAYRVLAGWRLTSQTVGGTNNLDVTMGYSWVGGSSKTVTITQQGSCEQVVAATGKPVGYQFPNNTYWTLSMTATPVSANVSGKVCPAGSKMIGLYSGPSAAGSNIANGPENIFRWGTTAAAGGFDPRGSDVKYKTTSECIADDGTKSSISAEWLGSDGAAKFPSCAAAGKGHGTGVNKIEGYAPSAPGVVGTTPETIWSTGAPSVDPNYEKCGPERPGSGCKMAITVDGNPCKVGQWECEHWSELKNDPNWGPRLGCTYGPYSLTLEQCAVMEPAYRPGGAPVTEENVDGDPNTRNNTQPGGGTFTPAQPATVPGAAGSPAPDAPSAECFPGGWAMLNPMWIVDGINCSFIPKKDIGARVTEAKANAMTKAPLTWFSPNITGPGGGGCPNWVVNVGGEFSENIVCNSSFTAAILGARVPLFGLLSAAMVWPLLRSLWYAAIPIMRVTPSSGGKD